jgi:polar amino acid transport system substrate-binding protein
MTKSVGFRCVLRAAIAIAAMCGLCGRPLCANTLQLITANYLGPNQESVDNKAPGFPIEVLRHVFAAMNQDVSFEVFPPNRSWMMIVRGERDGILAMFRTSEREQACSFPDEPLGKARFVFFVRKADVDTLKVASFDDLVGHDVAVRGAFPGLLEHPNVSPELAEYLRDHHIMVETSDTAESLRMLAAGHVDYAVENAVLGMRNVRSLGLLDKVAPLPSRAVMESGIYVCFGKARVSHSVVDAFSRALKQFKETETYQAIYKKYNP